MNLPFNAKRGYLSGPMTGIAEDNRPAFRSGARALRAMGFEVVSPDELDQIVPAAGHTWAEYLSRDIPFVVSCGFAALLPGWNKSKGALLEVAVMAALGRPVYELVGDPEELTVGLFGHIPALTLVEIPPEKLPRVQLPLS